MGLAVSHEVVLVNNIFRIGVGTEQVLVQMVVQLVQFVQGLVQVEVGDIGTGGIRCLSRNAHDQCLSGFLSHFVKPRHDVVCRGI